MRLHVSKLMTYFFFQILIYLKVKCNITKVFEVKLTYLQIMQFLGVTNSTPLKKNLVPRFNCLLKELWIKLPQFIFSFPCSLCLCISVPLNLTHPNYPAPGNPLCHIKNLHREILIGEVILYRELFKRYLLFWNSQTLLQL